jgi:putative DNA primase/helicase
MADRFALTDQGNAERFAETYGDDVCWVPAWRSFVYWRGDRWERDAGEFATARMVEAVKALGDTAREIEDDDLSKRIFNFAARSLTKTKIESSLALAKPLLFGRPTDFDSDRWLLNCRNGTLDLRKLELREHRREDMLTQQVDADYDPDARSEDWGRVLRESMQSDDLVAFLQRVFGYSLIGDRREEVFFFFYGKSGAGKGTILESFGGMIGDYARTMSHRTLTHAGPQSGSGASEDVARLHGARFVVASEFERGSRLAEAFVNTLTGGDKITARHLHQASFEFLPQLTLFLAANHKPRLSGSPQSGIWRRLVTVPFEHVPKAPDKELKSRLAGDDARAAILAWAVEGLRTWQAEGLGELPSEIAVANEEYREEADPYSIFIKERVKRVEGTDSTFKEMFAAFREWWDDSGRPPNRKTNITTLNRILRERGFEAGKRYYKRRGKRTSENIWKNVEVHVAGIRVQGRKGDDD